MRRINNIFSKLLLLLFIAGGFSAALSFTATAQERTVSLTAMPAVLDVGGQKGNKVEASFQLKNGSETVLPIHLSTRNSQIRDGQSQQVVDALSARRWITFSQPDFVLQANETKTVTAVLDIPADASPGGHYADLVVRALSLEGSDEFVSAQPEIVVQMFVSVPGDINESLRMKLDSPGTIITSKPESKKLLFDVANEGNIHTLFQPKLSLQRDDKDVAGTKAKPVILLPKERTSISITPPKDLKAGVYEAQLTFSYGSPAKQVNSQTVRLIIVPFSPMALLLLPLLGIAILGYRVRDRVIKAVRIITKGEKENI